MVPIRSHVICFEPLAALAQWLVPPASSELCQHVAAPNVGAMHIVLEGLSPSGKSSGFLDLHLAYFCLGTILRSRNVDNVDLLMLAHLRQKGTQIQVCSWQALALALESQWHRTKSVSLIKNLGCALPKSPWFIIIFPTGWGPPVISWFINHYNPH